MNKEHLQELINSNLSSREISRVTGKSQTTISYWLRKYSLKTNYNTENDSNNKRCSKCREFLDKSNFYNKGKGNLQPYCKRCNNQLSSQRWIDRKIWAIQYKGSKCNDCNISYPDTPYVVFDFHHLNPMEKDMDWSKIKLTSKEKMIDEINKCVLLCANCHRTRHFKEHL